MKVIVLGAGITGITTAWFLREKGHTVTVVDRQPAPSQETSFANGCQISVSHSEPWANPTAPLKVLKWLGKEDAPLLYKFQMDPAQWRWCLRWLVECLPKNTNQNIRDSVALCEYSRKVLGEVRSKLKIEYDHLTKGILHFYTSEKEFKDSLGAAQIMRELGVQRESISAERAIQLEPALARIRHQIVGADYTATDESGDVFKFTSQLARHCLNAEVSFRYNTTVTRLLTTDGRIKGVETISPNGVHETLKADAVVVCMGSYSRDLVKPLGLNLLIYPGKGYSATYFVNATHPNKAPTISLTDDEHKLVFSRLGNRLRVAGTCELNGYNRDLNMVRCEAITKRAKELFPDACDYHNPRYWTALRPLTPSNIPYVGPTHVEGLFLNTGHGTLGWTMGCGSGKAIADIITKGWADIVLREIK